MDQALIRSEECADQLHVSFALFPMRHVTRVLKDDPLDLWDCPEPGLDAKLWDFVVTPVQEKSVDVDVVRLF